MCFSLNSSVVKNLFCFTFLKSSFQKSVFWSKVKYAFCILLFLYLETCSYLNKIAYSNVLFFTMMPSELLADGSWKDATVSWIFMLYFFLHIFCTFIRYAFLLLFLVLTFHGCHCLFTYKGTCLFSALFSFLSSLSLCDYNPLMLLAYYHVLDYDILETVKCTEFKQKITGCCDTYHSSVPHAIGMVNNYYCLMFFIPFFGSCR